MHDHYYVEGRQLNKCLFCGHEPDSTNHLNPEESPYMMTIEERYEEERFSGTERYIARPFLL